MAISAPMGKAPDGASTSDAVTKLDISIGNTPKPAETCGGCCPCVPETDPKENELRKTLSRLRLENQVKKQEMIRDGKLPMKDVSDY